MTWHAWVGFVLFYGWLAALVLFGLVWAWDSWRHRTCRDTIVLGGRSWRCCLRHHHEPRIHRALGSDAPRWERRGEGWNAWVDPEPFVQRVVLHSGDHRAAHGTTWQRMGEEK